ncbi:hepatitis A virus cellular receptor 1-like [Cyprinus carpio]|uniref:Hepatitis A virus cellular receptor 1-like n=1 Tax=Cyprinus carpio TaxID=7962 RepID=A0A9Q9XIR6_CYPCA|nr:hepatitis A virus cellular receptor 1-like [Cyprinus carpio]
MASSGEEIISIQRGCNLPALNRCTSCCSLFHCPFCISDFFKPSKKNYTIHRCGLGCVSQLHYHCVYCSSIKIRRDNFVAHLKGCKTASKLTTIPDVAPLTASISTTIPDVAPLTASISTTIPDVAPLPSSISTTIPDVAPLPSSISTTIPDVAPLPSSISTTIPDVAPLPSSTSTTIPDLPPLTAKVT